MSWSLDTSYIGEPHGTLGRTDDTFNLYVAGTTCNSSRTGREISPTIENFWKINDLTNDYWHVGQAGSVLVWGGYWHSRMRARALCDKQHSLAAPRQWPLVKSATYMDRR
jgi:hypothetical protein